MNKVHAVRIDIYYMVMGETYCDCCGPEPDYEFQGYVIESLHSAKEDAEEAAKKVDIEVELTGMEYEFAQVSVVEMEVNQ